MGLTPRVQYLNELTGLKHFPYSVNISFHVSFLLSVIGGNSAL